MKLKILLVSLLFLVQQGFAQIKNVENSFYGCEPVSFKFYTLGNTHSGQTWNDGQGTTSTLDTATFLFNTAGTFTVSIGSLTQTIEIYPKLIYNFFTDSSKTGCTPFKFNLRDATIYPTGISPTKHIWVYENGGGKTGNPITDTILNYNKFNCKVSLSVQTNSPSCNGFVEIQKQFQILEPPTAKIKATPNFSCKVPFTPVIENLSGDFLHTDLNFLWKWSKPSPGTSTDSILNPITYTTNLKDKIILEVTNQFGCKAYDSAIVGIDTPSFDFIVPDKVCVNYDIDSGQLNIINLESADFDYVFNSATYIIARTLNDSTFKFIQNRRPTNYYPFSLTKVSKNDPTCKTTITKQIYLINDYPKPKLFQQTPCKSPYSDTVRTSNVTKNVDSIFYSMLYLDKYFVNVKDSFYGDGLPPKIYKKGASDSSHIFLNNIYNDIDSFYRKGPLTLYGTVTYFNKETKCYMTDTVQGIKNSIFRAYLAGDTNSGCVNQKNVFRIMTYDTLKVDTVRWIYGDNTELITKKDTTTNHIYSAAGVYRAIAIAKDKQGCIDTTNPVFVKRGDSTAPLISISKRNLCITDSTTFTLNNSSAYDRWFFVTDNLKSTNCPNDLSNTWKNFYNPGWQSVYFFGYKYGCLSRFKDSIYIDGPKYNLDFDFKCSRKDSIKFYLADTFGIRTLSHTWDFGDGTIINTLSDTLWHKFIGDSIDYKVKVTTTNISGCNYSDSTIVKIRKVKAFFTDTLFCKTINENELINLAPYSVDPSKSRNADYLCNYNYTWSLESIATPGNPAVKYPPFTFGSKVGIEIPLDSMNLSLIARDANGCSDTFTRKVIISDNVANFTSLNTGLCPPSSTIVLTNKSRGAFGIIDTQWIIYTLKNGILAQLSKTSIWNPSFTVNTTQADSFVISLTITGPDSFCSNKKTKFDTFAFVVDTSHLIIPKNVCQRSKSQIRSTENNLSKYQYRWFVNNILTTDTFSVFNYTFSLLGKVEVRLEKTHRSSGCKRIFFDTTLVSPYPRIRLENTFDTASNRCFPAVTKISYFDSTAITSLGYYFEHAGNKTYINPTNISLNPGVNQIMTIFTTAYGCIDTFINLDTVVKPRGDLIASRTAICKGEIIQFNLTNPQDIDTVLWVLGDGTEKYGKSLQISHNFPTANAISDTINMSYIAYAINKLCPVSVTIPILVYEARASHYLNNKIDTAYCFAPMTLTNTSSRADYFNWDFGDGIQDTTSKKTFNYNYKYPGKYQVKLKAFRTPLGCPDSSYRWIELFPKPEISAKPDTLCFGKDFFVYYKDTLPNVKIRVKPDFYNLSPYLSSPIKVRISDRTTPTIQLISESNKGCLDTTNASLTIFYPDTLKKLDTIIESGKQVALPFIYKQNYRYIWSPSLLNPSCINCSYPELTVIIPTTYKITMTDILGCYSDTSHYFIDVYPEIKVDVPKAFTPNGDGNNDIIYARGFGVKRLVSFKIFNRLGQLIFMTSDINTGWDGYYKNVLQNSDAYYYTYEAEAFIPKKFVSGEGNFMLLR